LDIPRETLAAYVQAAAALQGYELDAAQTAAVTLQFARIAQIGAAFLQDPLPPQAEPLPVFRP
jgi:hypothetical protein